MNLRLILICALMTVGLHHTGRGQSNFPVSWCGSYSGTMYLHGPAGIVDSVHVNFEMLPLKTANRWSYRMTYKSERFGEMVHDYELFWHDSLVNPNLFVLDEKNGILLNEQFANNRLYGHYEVENLHYMTLLQQEADGLYFEIRCTDPKKGLVSQSLPEDDGTIYHVKTFFQYMLQYVHLKRIKQ